jgi:hypothetical protein
MCARRDQLVRQSDGILRERLFRRAIMEFVEHYHLERNHQGLDNRLITGTPAADGGPRASALAPGRTLSYYERAA